jgi:Tfp pilus assembly protein PilF
LSSLVKMSFLNGNESEAWQWLERIPLTGDAKSDHLVKFAEAAAWLGADERVVEACRRFDEVANSTNRPHCGTMYHLGAVAEYRLGYEKKALALWKKATNTQRGSDLAEQNLAARKTSKEEFSPWYFAFRDWFPGQKNATWLVDWEKISEAEENDEALLNRWLSTHPSFIALLPAMLDRGDDFVRRLAIAITLGSERQEFVEPLRRFALGKKGTTDERFRVAQHLSAMGVLPAGEPIRLFVEGQWRDILLCAWEISDQPVATAPRSAEVQQLAQKGYESLERRDAKRGEEYLRRAVKLHPDAPDLWNNLAEALDHLGRADEASEIASMLRQRFPDYFFGVIRDAMHAIDNQNFEHAKTLLAGLLARKKLHLSEFRALVTAHIHLGLNSGDLQLAETWLGMWKQVEEHPWQLKIEHNNLSRGLFSRLFRLKG